MGLIMVSSRVRSLLLFLGVNLPGVGWAVFLVLVGRLPRLKGDLLLGVVNGGEVGVIGLVLGGGLWLSLLCCLGLLCG